MSLPTRGGTRRKLTVVGLTTAVLVIAHWPAKAQSAEETLWFILFGFDTEVHKNAPLSRTDIHQLSPNRWSIASSSPLGSFVNEVEILADPNNKCSYSVDVYDEKSTLQQRNFFDLSKVSSYKANSSSLPAPFGEGPSVTNIEMSGNSLYTRYARDPGTGKVVGTTQNTWQRPLVDASGDRLQRAYNFFQDKFCKGRPF
jgi:hypothetical protein